MIGQLKEELIIKRYSCRSYMDRPLSGKDISNISSIISANQSCPFGSEIRLMLCSALPGDSSSLKDLGTYGFIKNPAGFIIGAVKNSEMCLEDFGYVMEKIILEATALNLGTCWLGGSFKKSSFAARIGIMENESVPAVAAVGYIAEKESITDKLLKAGAGSKKRMPSGNLFFDESLKPLATGSSNSYNKILEMVRLAPSANNRQPWRIIKESDSNIFHLYLDRSSFYRAMNRMLKFADLQRIDMGIAMSHFELTSVENNLKGSWSKESIPMIKIPVEWEYTASWIGE